MKILKIRGKNINSLAGEWTVDFTDPELTADGIFVITGPTGSGKTTILDTLCLALYGQTPRLPKLVKTDDTVMTRGMNDCLAEAEFVTAEGAYRCTWSQRRSRGGPDKPIQSSNARHQIATLDGKDIVDKKVPARVAELTGMDFEQFTRTMLLAQGDFTAFLDADDNKKAEILEHLTKSDKYRRISQHVFERQRDLKTQLDAMLGQQEQIRILTPEELEQTQKDLAAAQTEAAALEAALRTERDARAWLTALEGMDAELDDIARQEEALAQEKHAAAPDMERLELARRALPAEQAAKEADALQERLDKTMADAAQTDKKMAEAQEALGAMQPKLDAAVQAVHVAQKAQTDAQPLIERALELDAQLAGYLARAKSAKEAADQQEDAWRRALGGTRGAPDDALAKARAKADKLEADHAAMQQACADTERARTELLGGRSDTEWLENEIQHAISELELRTKIASLEEERARLHDGAPCPLCGSVHHPYALGNVPQVSAARQKLDQLRDIQAKVSTLADEMHKQEKQAQKAKTEADALRQSIAQADVALQDLAAARKAQAEAEEELAAAQAERRTVLDGKPGIEVQKQLTAATEAARGRQSALEADAANMRAALTRLQGVRDTLHATRAEVEGLLRGAEAQLLQAVTNAGFDGVDQWRAACLPVADRTALEKRAADLDRRAAELTTRRTACTDKRDAERARALTTLSAAELDARILDGEQHAREVTMQAGSLEQRLRRDAEDRAARAGKEEEIRLLQEDWKRWQMLNVLVGSADGTKFVRQVQAITFEILLRHANDQLKTLSGRYSLVRSQALDPKVTDGLAISVCDDRQMTGNPIRSAKNLSGGEKFLVSLALALGLSEMAGSRARIDSLFLDEGFGTLDEHALGRALQTLASLHAGGKTIGVISHVAALRERLGSRIEVTPAGGGRSRISGPGVSWA